MGWGWLLCVLYRVRGRGSIPQPHQKLPSIDPAEVGGGAVVGAEVIPQPVLLRSVCRLVPVDGPVLRVGDGGDLIGEGHGSFALVPIV